MIHVLVGLGRSIRSATGGGSGAKGGDGGSFSCGWKGEGSRVLLRSALRSTAFGRRLPSGGPSIPLPQACSLEPNTARPGLGGLWRVGGWALRSASPQTALRRGMSCIGAGFLDKWPA